MLLAVFHEFAHPEILEKVKEICEVDIAPQPNTMATSPEEQRIVRTNAKLITVKHTIAAPKDAFDSMTVDDFSALEKEVDKKLEALVALGFKVEQRSPSTSAGYPTLDRVILSFPE